MKNVLRVASLFLVSVSCAFGQTGQAAMSPTVVVAGKSITVTITVNKTPSVDETVVSVMIAPKDPKDNPPEFGFNLSPRNNDPKVYTGASMVPPTAKGTWFIKEARLLVPLSGNTLLETNHPEFTVKPIEVTLPTSGKVEVTTP